MIDRRLLRGGLLALVAAVLGSVAWSLRRPAPLASAPPSQPRPSGSASPQSTRMADLVYVKEKAGKPSFVLRAKRMLGREQEQVTLEVVTAEFAYVSQGQPGHGRIVSDE